jgi:hypothetical protein
MTDARTLTLDLGGRWRGRYGTAACPVCQPERQRGQDALTLGDGDGGRLVLHCKKSACGFLDIMAAAGIRPGSYTPPDAATVAKREAERRAEAMKRAEQARRLWQEAQPIAGTVAEAYLAQPWHPLRPAPVAAVRARVLAWRDGDTLACPGGPRGRRRRLRRASHLPCA